jgi:glycosyltransferase involved in cell wall biosynthesis
MSRPSILAVVAVRNEAPYLRRLLPLLDDQSVDVALVDHDSTDESAEIIRSHLDAPVVILDRLPFDGTFSLKEQIEVKQAIASRSDHDWVVFQDADEILEGIFPDQDLRTVIEDADRRGYTALNFNEFVFLPEPGQDLTSGDYLEEMLRYYFYRPADNRLNRVWKRHLAVSSLHSGGHQLVGNGLKFPPENHSLRHYPALSQEHINDKYLRRVYNDAGFQSTWHKNRMDVTEEQLRIPVKSRYLHRLQNWDEKPLRVDRPVPRHYWEWKDMLSVHSRVRRTWGRLHRGRSRNGQ